MLNYIEKQFKDIFENTEFFIWSLDFFPIRETHDWIQCTKINQNSAIDLDTGLLIILKPEYEVFIETNLI
jgi:hypothetical protein